ncbi:preprotein translocase subunit SecA [Acidithrix sp. C25]|uniref:preprotein translocase subunit SecA n=1 Tax=Acidithrix sp. C25 TaxID=1671482 RepID=UPI000A84F9BF|nr:preprotein translocase subunit SecA [Acidithrix sp. C25]
MSVFSKVLRAGEGKKVKRLAEIVPYVNDFEAEISKLSDSELMGKTDQFKARFAEGEGLDDMMVEAFAVVREAAMRTIGQRHYDVQLMGGMALHFGWIAEMRTGEGKTLVSTLPVYLNALAGEGVHVVTVNDYLAQRDSEWMSRVYNFLGLSVGLILPTMDNPSVRKNAYQRDITYGTNTEFGFDYLRDNMAKSVDEMVQRGHSYAIIDEVDSILIDEARTPLIIAGPTGQPAKIYYEFASIVRTLRSSIDYEVDEEKKIVFPTEAGIDKVERALAIENLYDPTATAFLHQLNQALRAKELFKRDRDYIVDTGEVKIVDEFTGRILEGRRWSEGLHQAVEAKERVKIKEENHTWATVTLQNYFRMYEKLSGMTGTAETEAAEFASTYGLPVVPIPTNQPLVRMDNADLVYKSEDAKFQAVVEDIAVRFELGQPILVGTASVAKSEILSKYLERKGIPHKVLNAKAHEQEAEIVAQAGRLGAVTVATNMAGRGVDILLGGNPELLTNSELTSRGLSVQDPDYSSVRVELLEKYKDLCRSEGERVRELGGLYVLGSERHESRRIDNQLRGRSGRQGDPGESRFFLSLEDDLMRLFATGAVSAILERTFPDDLPIENRMVSRAIEKAQTTVEGRNAEIRKEVLKYDEVLNEQRKVVYERRYDVLNGRDLKESTMEILEDNLDRIVNANCVSDFIENWDLDHLILDATAIYPTGFHSEDLKEAISKDQIIESLLTEAEEYYEDREQRIPGGSETMRAVEREVMLSVIDTKWREHLAEMDYLREGINLRAMGQQDPLVAWQREGFELFGKLMSQMDSDYLTFVMHVEVMAPSIGLPVGTDLAAAFYQSPQGDIADLGSNGQRSAMDAFAVPGNSEIAQDEPTAIGRNDKCWCGSGRKFKHCHGQNSD